MTTPPFGHLWRFAFGKLAFGHFREAKAQTRGGELECRAYGNVGRGLVGTAFCIETLQKAKRACSPCNPACSRRI